MSFNDFLNIKLIKILNCYIVPIIIGALFSALGSWDFKNDKNIYIKLVAIAIFILWYIITSYKYYKMDEKVRTTIKELQITIQELQESIENLTNQNEAYGKVLISLTSLFSTCAEKVNYIANSLLTKQTKLDNYNYKTVCTGICNGIYETLCLLSGYSNISVSVMLYDVNAKSRSKNIRMIAEKGEYENHPDIYDTPLYLNKSKDFYAVKLFKKNSPDISILTTANEIDKNFVFSDNTKEHPKYNQYIGVPIFCSGHQMISLLQICAFNNSKIGNTKEEIMTIVNKYILPFTYYALLNNKVEKGFINSISMIEEASKQSCQQ